MNAKINVFSSMSNSSVSFSGIFSNSATNVQSFADKLDKENIKTCVVGISALKGNSVSSRLTHAALFLSSVLGKNLDRDGGEGILIEYGDYSPDLNEKEKVFVKNGYVIYRYGDKGGLRYYVQSFSDFKKIFADRCYIILDVDKDSQISFSFLLDEIASKSEEIWIKKNYNEIGIIKQTVNCQTFTSKILDLLKPKYDYRFIQKGTSITKDENMENEFPPEVLKTMKKY